MAWIVSRRTFGGLRDTPGTSNPFPQYRHHAYQSRGNFWKETPVRRLWNEVLAVTEMTWDNADIADSGPVTSCFARKVGEILSYIPEEPHPSYRGLLERTFARHHSLLGTLAPVFTEIASTYPCATAPQRNSRKQLSSTSDSE